MLKELNAAFGAACSTVATTAAAIEDGSKILRLKGAAAKQIVAIESVKAIKEAKTNLSEEELKAALELLSLVD